MTTQGFVVTHAPAATFERGLRSFYEYRDLGIKQATYGRGDAQVIRAAAGRECIGGAFPMSRLNSTRKSLLTAHS